MLGDLINLIEKNGAFFDTNGLPVIAVPIGGKLNVRDPSQIESVSRFKEAGDVEDTYGVLFTPDILLPNGNPAGVIGTLQFYKLTGYNY